MNAQKRLQCIIRLYFRLLRDICGAFKNHHRPMFCQVQRCSAGSARSQFERREPPVEYVRDHILKHFRDDDLETVQLVSDEGLTGVVVLLWRHDHSRARVQESASVGAVGCTEFGCDCLRADFVRFGIAEEP